MPRCTTARAKPAAAAQRSDLLKRREQPPKTNKYKGLTYVGLGSNQRKMELAVCAGTSLRLSNTSERRKHAELVYSAHELPKTASLVQPIVSWVYRCGRRPQETPTGNPCPRQQGRHGFPCKRYTANNSGHAGHGSSSAGQRGARQLRTPLRPAAEPGPEPPGALGRRQRRDMQQILGQRMTTSHHL